MIILQIRKYFTKFLLKKSLSNKTWLYEDGKRRLVSIL